MSMSLPRVNALTRERVARELDDRGPDVCLTEVVHELQASNPEVLDMAMRCARDVGDFPRVMTGFCTFYRLLSDEARTAAGASRESADARSIGLLPRVSATTREAIVRRIDAIGPDEFTRQAIAELERDNPELLLMSHNFAEDQKDYIGVMQGFALIYASLLEESRRERGPLH